MNVEIFIHAFTALFVIMDPIGVAGVFVSVGRDYKHKELQMMAQRGVIIAACVLLVFGLFGQSILQQLGITTAAFRVAGGLLLFATAFQMIMTKPRPNQQNVKDAVAENQPEDLSVFPLAIPLLAGPGTITTTILLTAPYQKHIDKQEVFLALLAVLVIAWLCLMFAGKIRDYMGKIGISLFSRVLGIILAALSVQYIADGIKALSIG